MYVENFSSHVSPAKANEEYIIKYIIAVIVFIFIFASQIKS